VNDVPVLRDLGLVLASATVLLVLTRRLHLPSLLAYILAGIVLGPVLGVFVVSESLGLFSELGVALLLFLVGLELGFEKLGAVGVPAFLAGLLQVALTTGAALGLSVVLGFEPLPALILAAATAISSTVVVVKLLERIHGLDRLEGRLAIGILLVQDVVVAVLLTLLAAAGTGTQASALEGIASAFAGVAALVVLAWVSVRTLVPRLLAWLTPSPEGLFVVGLAWVFAFIVAAETLHVSIELGALIAGVALAQLPQSGELRSRVHPLVDLFLAVFFVGLGVGMDPGAVLRQGVAIAGLSLFVVIGKPVIVTVLLSIAGQPRRESLLAGITLGQVSEFSLILGAVAAGSGLVGGDVLSVLGLLALVSITTSSIVVPLGPALVERAESGRFTGPLLSLLPARPVFEEEKPPRTGHVVVVGMNALGRGLVHQFTERGHEVVAVDTDLRKLEGLPAVVVQGSANDPEVLVAAEAERALLVVSALQIEDTNLLLTRRCEDMGVPVSVHAFDPSLADEFLGLGADQVMIPKLDGLRTLETRLRERGVMG
jgi:Kef-type K+ transport system membrane component KefB